MFRGLSGEGELFGELGRPSWPGFCLMARAVWDEDGGESCQGFYFARPMTADNLDLLTRQSATGVDLRLPAVGSLA